MKTGDFGFKVDTDWDSGEVYITYGEIHDYEVEDAFETIELAQIEAIRRLKIQYDNDVGKIQEEDGEAMKASYLRIKNMPPNEFVEAMNNYYERSLMKITTAMLNNASSLSYINKKEEDEEKKN